MDKRLDGGYGWAIVFGKLICCAWRSLNFTANLWTSAQFMVLLACSGTAKANGVFYVYVRDEFQVSFTATAAVFMTQRIFQNATTIIFSFLAECYGSRPIMLGGAILMAGGTVASAFVKTIFQLTLTFGMLNGIGSAMLMSPGMQMLPKYFDKRLAISQSIIFCGGSLGVLLFPFIIEYSVMIYGVRGSFFIIACVYMQVFISVALMRPASYFQPTETGDCHHHFDKPMNHRQKLYTRLRKYLSCLKHNSLLLFFFVNFSCFAGIASFGAYQQAQAKDMGITDPTLLASLTSIRGVCEVGIRLVIGFLLQSRVILPYRLQQITCLGFVVVLVIYPFLDMYWMIVCCSVLAAIVWSCHISSTFPTIRLLVGIEQSSAAYGLTCLPTMAASLFVLTGGISRDLFGSFLPMYFSSALLLILGVVVIEILAWREKTSLIYKYSHRLKNDDEPSGSDITLAKSEQT